MVKKSTKRVTNWRKETTKFTGRRRREYMATDSEHAAVKKLLAGMRANDKSP